MGLHQTAPSSAMQTVFTVALGAVVSVLGGCGAECPPGTRLDAGACVLECPVGSARNAEGNACVSIVQCGDGFVFDDEKQGCVCAPGTEPTADGQGCTVSPFRTRQCSDGFVFDADLQACVCAPGTVPTADGTGCTVPPSGGPRCNNGFVFDADLQACVCAPGTVPTADGTGCTLPAPEPEPCSDGFVFDEESGACVCAPGTEPLAGGTGCIFPPFIEPLCGDGFTLNETRDGCVAIPETRLLVFGVVRDAVTQLPISGAAVSLRPQGVAPVVTDALGYFEFENNLEPGTYRLQYLAEGFAYDEFAFEIDQQDINTISNHINVDGRTLDVFQQDASINLDPLPSRETFAIAGTVYGENRVARGATVLLFLTGSSDIFAQTTTNDVGRFRFDVVPGGSYFLRVPGFDEDGDAVLDFGRRDLALGQLGSTTVSGDNSGATSGLNLTNLVIQLQGLQKRLLATNFLPEVPAQVFDPSTFSTPAGLRLLSSTSPVVLHFGHEVDINVFNAVLRQLEVNGLGTRVDRIVNATVAWNPENTVVTITPSAPLQSNVNDDHFFELVINSFRWADNQEVLPLERTSQIVFAFDIAAAPIAPPASPTPSFFIADRVNPDTGIAAQDVSCDEFACWVVDGSNAPVFGFATPSNSGANRSFLNENGGFTLQWTHVQGAVAYRIHARQVNLEPSFANFSAFSEATGTVSFANAVVPNVQPTVHATGVLAGAPGGGLRTWRDFSRNAFGPLGVGNTIEIAVTSVDVFGNESAIDPARVLTLGDEREPSIAAVVPGANTARDAARVTEILRIDFTENMDTTTTPTFASLAGSTRVPPIATFVSWDNTGSQAVPENLSTAARVATDLRHLGSCTRVVCNMVLSDPNRDRICVEDASAIVTGQGLIFVNDQGTTVTDNLPANSDGTLVLQVTATDPLNNLLTVAAAGVNAEVVFNTTLGGRDLFACSIGGIASSQSLAAATALNDAFFTVPNAAGFRSNQRVLLLNRDANPNITVVATTAHLDTSGATNRIFVQAGLPALPATTVVIALPERPGRREAVAVPLRSIGATVANDDTLSFTNDLLSSDAMVGDLVLIDADGDLDTINDHFYGRVVDFVEAPETTVGAVTVRERVNVLLGAPPAGFAPIPDGTALIRQESVVVFLGDAWQITGGTSDTSGNEGLSSFRRAFATCTSITDEQGNEHCRSGTFAF